jgi:decaprenyl-phosphate phosphoribosyltransferase
VASVEESVAVSRPRLKGYLELARVDHWFKHVFVVPGMVAAVGLDPAHVAPDLALRILIGLISISLVASSYYVINEVMDAPFDRWHPSKWKRPVPSGRVNVALAYIEWIALTVVGIGLGLLVSPLFAATMAAFCIMGCIYNLPPVRTKDIPYLDVLSESVNNPLRMLAGWFVVGSVYLPPASLLLSYWMVGCYFMTMKRFAEYRDIGDHVRAVAYRKSFAACTEERLLVTIMFYGSCAMLFLGAFAMRYRLELLLSFPLIALVMAIYLSVAFKKESPVQRPEHLYREPMLMLIVVACAVAIGVLMVVDIPFLPRLISPTAPTAH